jgi:hypothetical protein
MWNRISIATSGVAFKLFRFIFFHPMTQLASNLVTVSHVPLTVTADRWLQFAAILGDLEHKKDVYLTLRDFGPHIDRLFSNSAQAHYLRQYRPDLVPPCEPNGTCPSDKTLGTVFEHRYYTDLQFRTDYLSRVRLL